MRNGRRDWTGSSFSFCVELCRHRAVRLRRVKTVRLTSVGTSNAEPRGKDRLKGGNNVVEAEWGWLLLLR